MRLSPAILCASVLLALTPSVSAYSVLSHEALVDALWDVKLRGLLLERFPNSSPEDLRRAHGFAYGGAIIQDIGYYPQAAKEFSDLTHYVRTGDFIQALLHEARNLDELAFALGALTHYAGDTIGHPNATNICEPMLYPRLRKKFGNRITYEDDPAGHLKTEFGFDVLEVARGNFAPQAYHDFIGFYVAKDLVGRAFRDTYGLELGDLFDDFDVAVSSCRAAVSRAIPLATKIAWAQKKKEIAASQTGATHRRFVYVMRRSAYEREWGRRLDEPNFLAKLLAVLLKLIPPIGPLHVLQLKIPTPQAEQLFMASFTSAVNECQRSVDEERQGTLALSNKNYDVGVITPRGVYRLNDEAAAFWLKKLSEKKFATATPAIRQALRNYFGETATIPDGQ